MHRRDVNRTSHGADTSNIPVAGGTYTDSGSGTCHGKP